MPRPRRFSNEHQGWRMVRWEGPCLPLPMPWGRPASPWWWHSLGTVGWKIPFQPGLCPERTRAGCVPDGDHWGRWPHHCRSTCCTPGQGMCKVTMHGEQVCAQEREMGSSISPHTLTSADNKVALSFHCLSVWDRVLPCATGWPWTHLPSAGIKSLYHHAWILCIYYLTNENKWFSTQSCSVLKISSTKYLFAISKLSK